MKWYPMAYPKEKVLRTYSQSVRAKTKDLPWTSCQLMKALFAPEYLAYKRRGREKGRGRERGRGESNLQQDDCMPFEWFLALVPWVEMYILNSANIIGLVHIHSLQSTIKFHNTKFALLHGTITTHSIDWLTLNSSNVMSSSTHSTNSIPTVEAFQICYCWIITSHTDRPTCTKLE